MKQYKLVNNLTGWITFLIAATVYLLTMAIRPERLSSC